MILYLDTSSLVKIFVEEDGSQETRVLVSQANWVSTSVVAYAEARSAFARQAREGALTSDEHRAVKASLELNWQRFLVLKVTDEIRSRAGDLAEAYALRGFDSLHLASYLELARSAPRSAVARFSSFDVRLNQAADAAAQRDEARPP